MSVPAKDSLLAAADAARQTCSATHTNVGEMERLLSIAGGAALGAYGFSKKGLGGLLLSAIGGSLIYRGLRGHCYAYEALGIESSHRSPATAVPAQQGVRVERTVTINRPPVQVYQQWQDLEQLPQYLHHLKSVQQLGNQRSHWVAQGVAGETLQWDAEIWNQRENELLAWRSLPGGDVETAGSIRLQPLGDGQATQMNVVMKYNPPGGKVGDTVASWFGQGLRQKLDEDLQRFKAAMETAAPSSM